MINILRLLLVVAFIGCGSSSQQDNLGAYGGGISMGGSLGGSTSSGLAGHGGISAGGSSTSSAQGGSSAGLTGKALCAEDSGQWSVLHNGAYDGMSFCGDAAYPVVKVAAGGLSGGSPNIVSVYKTPLDALEGPLETIYDCTYGLGISDTTVKCVLWTTTLSISSASMVDVKDSTKMCPLGVAGYCTRNAFDCIDSSSDRDSSNNSRAYDLAAEIYEEVLSSSLASSGNTLEKWCKSLSYVTAVTLPCQGTIAGTMLEPIWAWDKDECPQFQ